MFAVGQMILSVTALGSGPVPAWHAAGAQSLLAEWVEPRVADEKEGGEGRKRVLYEAPTMCQALC